MTAIAEFTNANIWTEWFPESELHAVLAGEVVIPNIGQVKGVWKKALQREVKAGRLVTWKGYWFPVAGAQHGIGPLKTCYGTAEARAVFVPAGA
ncbi:hypothetical protein J1C56_01835 [Aminobacter anthyllidis]|uniref:Uncharacterized protein n=1 Tax=Aminobacter anthyllidis TaxID=1035067 RepID=A0A9X1A767_9HYPH|nr:hypothetical protein [Aminobacter anthyllidis]MBT1154325.1 hypothetical protein [Aminobacter anthyllidis]